MKAKLLLALLLIPCLPGLAAESAPPPATQMSLTGFTPLFNGRDMTGWHWSRTNRHGSIGGFRVENGAMAIFQQIYGQGGILMTNKRYKDFELYLETDLQSGNPGFNSGIFVRTTASGYGYQVELTGGGGTSDMIVEAIPGLSVPARAAAGKFAEVWKTSGWNTIRLRMVGDAPRMTLWLNDVQMWDVQQTRNSQIAGQTDGHIGLQLHWTALTSDSGGTVTANVGNTRPGLPLRVRNIFIKEL